MATTVGPARHKADNSFDRCSIASNVWLPVRRFHVGTSAQTLTQDAGYTTATDSALTYLRRPSSFAGGVHIRAVRHHCFTGGWNTDHFPSLKRNNADETRSRSLLECRYATPRLRRSTDCESELDGLRVGKWCEEQAPTLCYGYDQALW